MKFNLKDWFNTHMLKTESTLIFDELTPEKKKKIASEFQLSEQECIVYSEYDNENFAVITNKKVIWICDGKKEDSEIIKISRFGREGDSLDEKYELNEPRYYDGEKIVRVENPEEELTKCTRANDIRMSSPLVYIKETNGNVKKFKIQAGHTVDTILVGLSAQKENLLKGWGAKIFPPPR